MEIRKNIENELVDIIGRNTLVLTKEKTVRIITWSIISTTAVILCLVFLFFRFSDKPLPLTGPYGKITSPVQGSETGSKVRITGKTDNLEPGQYLWLVVDKPDISLCWPKVCGIKPNTGFKTIIYENGPEEPYMLSLYSVNQAIHDRWKEWLINKSFGGLPILPEKRRLDSVKLVLDVD